jgi:hypothetical protein
MSPWDASAFIDGKWKDIYISNEELFEALIKEYQKAEQETKEEDVEEEDDEEDVEEEDDEN